MGSVSGAFACWASFSDVSLAFSYNKQLSTWDTYGLDEDDNQSAEKSGVPIHRGEVVVPIPATWTPATSCLQYRPSDYNVVSTAMRERSRSCGPVPVGAAVTKQVCPKTDECNAFVGTAPLHCQCDNGTKVAVPQVICGSTWVRIVVFST